VLEVLRQPLEDGVIYIQSRGRPRSSYIHGVSQKSDGRDGFRQRTIAAHHRDRHHASSVSPPPSRQPLQPSRAFRLTPAPHLEY
jgi:hypothetical protein